MGRFGARTRKPTMLFGTVSSPQLSWYLLGNRMHARLRPWIHALEGKLNEKDKIRIEKHKQDTDQPMVIKKIDKKGKRTVLLGSKYS